MPASSPFALGTTLRWSLVSLLLAATGACSCCCRLDDDCERVRSVELLPRTTYSQAGQTFQLTAVARDEDGYPIVADLPFKYDGTVTIVSRDNDRVVVGIPATPGTFTVTARVGSHESEPARIIVLPSGAGDVVAVPHTAGAEPVEALLDARDISEATADKANDRQFSVVGQATLPVNFAGDWTASGVPNEVALFVPGRAAEIRPLASTHFTAAAGDIVSATSSTPPIPLDVTVWYFVETGGGGYTPIERATDDLALAQRILERTRAGVRIGSIDHRVQAITQDLPAGTGCTQIAGTLGFTPVPKRLNVVLVEDIAFPSAPFGLACPNLAGDISLIVIDAGAISETTLAHEIGHVLGLASPPFPSWMYETGHVDEYASHGFDETNLMWAYPDPRPREGRRNLTLGQIFRFHADQASWINNQSMRPSTDRTADCGGSPLQGGCPRLALEIGKP